MATVDDLRQIALSLAGVEERDSYGGRPSWKVDGHGFVGLWKDGTSAALMVEDLAEKQALLESEPEKYFSTPHYRDSSRLLVRLAAVDVDELRDLVTDAWRLQGGR